MLTLRICLNDLQLASRNDQPNLDSATFLDFFKSDLITNSVTEIQNGFEIWVGEASDPFSTMGGNEARFRNTRLVEDFDGVRVTALGEATLPSVAVARTAGGTSPLYISVNKSKICMSWKFEEVVALLDDPQPNIEICRISLKHGSGQTRDQVIKGIFSLWPGESVIFDSNGLRFSVYENINIVLPAAFSDRARVTDAFLETIAEVIRPMLIRSRRPLLEFSGGMDSTCIALAASSVRSALESYGVIHPGAVGRQQRLRRSELIDLLGLVDYTGSSSSILPIESLLIDECQYSPNDDSYRMCLLNTLQGNGLKDVDLVICGIGGDELAKDNTFLREEWEVPGHASRSALVGSTGRFDMFMRRGIWPVNPFAHPSLVNLCRAMPDAIRKDRLFNRLAIARAGLSDGYLTPRYSETFANVLMLEAIECDFDQYLNTSILGDFGIIDVAGLLAKAHAEAELGVSILTVSKMYDTIKLEMVLRKYIH